MRTIDPTLIPALGGTVGLLSVAGWLVVTFMRENATQRKERVEELIQVKKERAEAIGELKRDVNALKVENITCRFQVNSLISYLQAQGLAIPNELLRGVTDGNN